MQTLLRHLETAFTEAIRKSFPELSEQDAAAELAPCQMSGFGHYQCNSAMRLTKVVRKNPREVAKAMIDALDGEVKSSFEKLEIAGPGFINLTLSASFLSEEVQKILFDPFLGAASPEKREKVVIDFSSPNVAKELHVGHIRSTIIGDCLARLFEFLGHDVLRLNHIGDWGTQFGMLITYMKAHAPEVLEGNAPTTLDALMGWYRAAKRLFDGDPEFKKLSQLEVVRLQSGEEDAMRAWEIICDVSRQGFQEIYDLLDVRIQERGESFYNPFLREVVAELEDKGLITVSDGAKCLFLDGFVNRDGQPLPLIVQKSDGGYSYDTTDLAAIRYRIFADQADRIIYVIDAGQSLHLQMIFKAAELAGWLDPSAVRVDHVGFGLVLGADGKKFKTRSGETERLIDLLTEAVDRARSLLLERGVEKSEIETIARTIGIGAVKYADLSSHRTKDYTFSYDKMLRFDGNTAVFLLYAFVRINGIKRKTGADMVKILEESRINLQHPSEIALGLHLRRFGEVLDLIALELLPNRLTDYLYELSEAFNAFFRDCRVEGSDEEESRLLLCEATSKILKQGLELLGLQTLERM